MILMIKLRNKLWYSRYSSHVAGMLTNRLRLVTIRAIRPCSGTSSSPWLCFFCGCRGLKNLKDKEGYDMKFDEIDIN